MMFGIDGWRPDGESIKDVWLAQSTEWATLASAFTSGEKGKEGGKAKEEQDIYYMSSPSNPCSRHRRMRRTKRMSKCGWVENEIKERTSGLLVCSMTTLHIHLQSCARASHKSRTTSEHNILSAIQGCAWSHSSICPMSVSSTTLPHVYPTLIMQGVF